MNENKKGKKYQFSRFFHSFDIGYIKGYFSCHIGKQRGHNQGYRKSLPDHRPSYDHICKRINKLKVNFISSIKAVDDDDDMIIAIDSIGIKVTNRGQWMSDK